MFKVSLNHLISLVSLKYPWKKEKDFRRISLLFKAENTLKSMNTQNHMCYGILWKLGFGNDGDLLNKMEGSLLLFQIQFFVQFFFTTWLTPEQCYIVSIFSLIWVICE